MDKKELTITVNDNILKTGNQRFYIVLLFIVCFTLQFALYSFLGYMGVFNNTHMEEYMPEIALLVTIIIICLYYHIREKKTNGVMHLTVSFLSDSFEIIINGKKYIVMYNEIKEICKMMVIDRVHDKKGCYKMKIKCHGKRNIEFETTDKEYEQHLDFEDTGLFVFYDACKKAGLKCC